jgi:hypothetical protein
MAATTPSAVETLRREVDADQDIGAPTARGVCRSTTPSTTAAPAVGRIEQRRGALPRHRDVARRQKIPVRPFARQPLLDVDAVADRLVAVIGADQQQDLLAFAAQPLDGAMDLGYAAIGLAQHVRMRGEPSGTACNV